MKKAILFFLLLLVFPFSLASAQTNIYPIPIRPPVPNFQNFLGENQNYSVVFRGNGETVISFKSVLYNQDATPLSTIKIHFSSDILPQDLAVFQVLQQPYCIRYNPYLPPSPLPYGKPQPLSLENNGNSSSTIIPSIVNDQNCEEYQEPDYQNLYYGNTTYQKLTVDYSNNTLTFSLFSPIQQNKYGSYFVYLRSFAYTRKNLFGGYDYSFQTPKFETKINNLQIGITTDSDLFLKGVSGKVQYGSVKSFGGVAAIPAGASGIHNPQFDQFYNQIGQGDIIKNASNLQPLETYTVNGLYADSNWKLYGKEIGTGIIVFIILAILIFLTIKYLLRKFGKKHDKPSEMSSSTSMFFITAGLSFLSVFLIFLYSLGSFLILYVTRNSQFAFVLIFFTMFLSFAVYLFLLFIAPIGMTIKKGYMWGIICFGLNIFWMMIFFGITIAILVLFFPGTDYSAPLRMLGL